MGEMKKHYLRLLHLFIYFAYKCRKIKRQNFAGLLKNSVGEIFRLKKIPKFGLEEKNVIFPFNPLGFLFYSYKI